jgi:hypothetical protein
MDERKCTCNCPKGFCEHNFDMETFGGVCRECGETWEDHRDEVFDRMNFEALLRYI